VIQAETFDQLVRAAGRQKEAISHRPDRPVQSSSL
jgi:hypothetical protein